MPRRQLRAIERPERRPPGRKRTGHLQLQTAIGAVMKTLIRTLLFVALAGYVGLAQQAAPKAPPAVARAATARALPVASSDSVGVSSERLERLHKGMQDFVDRHEVGGVVTLIARDGKVADVHANGFQDVES